MVISMKREQEQAPTVKWRPMKRGKMQTVKPERRLSGGDVGLPKVEPSSFSSEEAGISPMVDGYPYSHIGQAVKLAVVKNAGEHCTVLYAIEMVRKLSTVDKVKC
jgi:hypothetical protein